MLQDFRKICIYSVVSLFVFFSSLSISAFAEDKPPLNSIDIALQSSNYLATKRILVKTVANPCPKDKLKRKEWTQSLLALISLERLMGEEQEALKQFARCDIICRELLSQEEWRSLLAWGCVHPKKNPSACKLHAP